MKKFYKIIGILSLLVLAMGIVACTEQKVYKTKYDVIFWCEGEVLLSYKVEEGDPITRLPDLPDETSGYEWEMEPLPDAVFRNTTIRITRKAKTFKVTFQSDYSYVYPDTLEIKFGSTMKDMPIPEREGYKFLGYYFDDRNKLYTPESVFDIASDVTLKASWKSLFVTEPLDDDGYKLVGYIGGNADTITVPSYIDGTEVKQIEKGLLNNVSVRVVNLPFLGMSVNDEESAYLGYIFGLERGEQSALPSSLKEVYIEQAKIVYDGAFENCSRLSVIELPDTVERIGANAFNNCSSLKEINLTNVIEIGDYAFNNCRNSSFTELKIPAVKAIGEGAFYGCSSLKEVNINKVDTISSFAFFGCSSLRYVNISAATPPQLGVYAFYIDDDDSYMIIPNLKIKVPTPSEYKQARQWEEYSQCIELMSSSGGVSNGEIR